jgi:hypothetical protein
MVIEVAEKGFKSPSLVNNPHRGILKHGIVASLPEDGKSESVTADACRKEIVRVSLAVMN